MSDEKNITRLQQKLEALQQQYELQSEKIERLRKAYAIETDTAERFKLEKQIQQEETTRDDLESKMRAIENSIGVDFQAEWYQDFAHPIAVGCAEYHAAQTDKERFQALDCLLNNLIKYFTAIALSQYWQDNPKKNNYGHGLENCRKHVS